MVAKITSAWIDGEHYTPGELDTFLRVQNTTTRLNVRVCHPLSEPARKFIPDIRREAQENLLRAAVDFYRPYIVSDECCSGGLFSGRYMLDTIKPPELTALYQKLYELARKNKELEGEVAYLKTKS
jgi:hypothetical protein